MYKTAMPRAEQYPIEMQKVGYKPGVFIILDKKQNNRK